MCYLVGMANLRRGRLLAANDASFTALPDKPTFDFERETADPSLPSTLPQAVDNPLSQLTVFNALTFTSFSSPVVLDDDAAATAQHHEITGYVGDKHLFFRIHTAVALSSLTVLSISNTLSPWARRELSPALARFAAEKDISATLYAINSYAALARKRAATFARLSHAFPRLLPSFAPRQTHQCKGKQKSDSAYEPSRRDITAQMGEAVLRFRDQQAARQAPKSRVNGSLGGADSGRESGEVEFVLEWRVQVDDVGEAESRVRGEARVPVHCTSAVPTTQEPARGHVTEANTTRERRGPRGQPEEDWHHVWDAGPGSWGDGGRPVHGRPAVARRGGVVVGCVLSFTGVIGAESVQGACEVADGA